jgi:reductive dehalogenase
MIIQITGILLLSFVIISALTILIFSYDENEKRAVNISLFAAFMAGVFLMLVLQANSLISIYTAGTVSFLFLCTVLFLLLAKKKKYAYYPPKHKTDERRTMFSRAELKPGSANFNAYYKEYPNDFPLDQVWRKNPGLMSSDAKFFESFSFAAANASFHTVDLFKDAVNFTENKKKKPVDPKQMSKFLTNWAVHLGAHSAGITPLKSYHLYSRRGRGTEYGKPVNNQHTFALAFTVEMNKTHIDSAPKGPTLAESAKQYLNAGAVAMQLAAFINSFGYSARAHIDGNYEIMCPLVARDSGLGEIGRMGLLMTPILGPRVRIGAVTTDIPLIPNETRFAEDVIDFCSQCKKCAEVCPSKAIPSGEREEVQGVIRWQINQEACFNYWTLTGTDCARCVSVCPYSHENNLMHNIIRKGLRQSAAFRKIAIQADNWLYGKKPASKALPDIYQ